VTADRRSLDGLNWARWGPDDERGAPNLLTPERVRRALQLPRSGDIHPLGRPLDRSTPLPAHRPALSHFMLRDAGDFAGRPDPPTQFADDVVVLSMHTGTHVDALAHLWHGEQLYNGFPRESVGSRGARRCGIDKLGPLVGRGVLADLAGHAGVEALEDGAAVSAEDLERCLSEQGTALAEADIVLLRTGWWSARAAAPGQDFASEPGPDLGAAAWLAERQVAAVGADNFALEVLPPAGQERGFPVHELLLRDCGVPILEGLDLDSLATAQAYEFLFVAAPLPVVGGTASPLNPIAVV
jgi:kynurenine formamidase